MNLFHDASIYNTNVISLLPLEMIFNITLFIDHKTKANLRLLCKHFRYLVDFCVPFFKGLPFLQEYAKWQLARQVCAIMTSNVDTNHPIFIYYVNNQVERLRKTTDFLVIRDPETKYKRNIVNYTHFHKFLYDKNKTWLILTKHWARLKITKDIVDEFCYDVIRNGNTRINKKCLDVCAFYGINYDSFVFFKKISNSTIDIFHCIPSTLPGWVNDELLGERGHYAS